MRFLVNLDYKLKDIKQFQKLHQKVRTKALYVISNIVLAAALLAILVSTGMLIYFRGFDSEIIRYYIIILVAIGALIVVRLVTPRTMLKALRSHGSIDLTIDDEGIHEKSEKITADYSYPSICDIVHSKEAFYLYIGKLRAIIIPERCFVEGDPAAFGAFLEQKTGLKLKEIK